MVKPLPSVKVKVPAAVSMEANTPTVPLFVELKAPSVTDAVSLAVPISSA